MRLCRAVCTAVIAISVAWLPIPGALAHAPAAEPSLHAAECCDASAPCEKESRDCDASSSCVQKCSSVPGALVQRLALAPWTLKAALSLAGQETFRAKASAPPLPPPRI
jgi:hypothetical protein